MKLAIVVSRFNNIITDGLLKGAIEQARELGVPEKNVSTYYAPGAFEMPLIAQTLAKTRIYDGVVCLGAVIKGDTAHFEFISLGATMGIMQSMLYTETPITFGILTTYDSGQAINRSSDDAHNKGREALKACAETINLIADITDYKRM